MCVSWCELYLFIWCVVCQRKQSRKGILNQATESVFMAPHPAQAHCYGLCRSLVKFRPSHALAAENSKWKTKQKYAMCDAGCAGACSMLQLPCIRASYGRDASHTWLCLSYFTHPEPLQQGWQ
jgi:hypothetical protein